MAAAAAEKCTVLAQWRHPPKSATIGRNLPNVLLATIRPCKQSGRAGTVYLYRCACVRVCVWPAAGFAGRDHGENGACNTRNKAVAVRVTTGRVVVNGGCAPLGGTVGVQNGRARRDVRACFVVRGQWQGFHSGVGCVGETRVRQVSLRGQFANALNDQGIGRTAGRASRSARSIRKCFEMVRERSRDGGGASEARGRSCVCICGWPWRGGQPLDSFLTRLGWGPSVSERAVGILEPEDGCG